MNNSNAPLLPQTTPQNTPWLTHAESLLEQRHLSAALSCFNLAERRGADPDRCSAGRWTLCMLEGKFEEAWRESDAIRRRGAPDPHRFWKGESVRGKRVIVRCLHGLGDTVQLLPLLARLHRIAAHLILEVPPSLLDFARLTAAADQIITWGEAAPAQPPQWDVQLEITELPLFFRIRQRDLPLASNRPRLPESALRAARKPFRNDRRLQVGIVWSAGGWNPSRSIPLDTLAPLFSNADCAFWNVQGGDVRSQWAALPTACNLQDAPALCADAGIVPLAAFLSQLDLVLTVDTLDAHLAGALGRPTWLLLQHAADWRWMVDRTDSPWYPSLRIFRQHRQGDWASLIPQLQQALAETASPGVREKAA